MLEALGGAVTIGLMALSFVVGVRLIALGRRTGGPELWLGLYFLLYGCFATTASICVYVGWSSASLAPSDTVARRLNAAFFALSTAGMSCLLLFTQRTFRPGHPGAQGLVAGTIAVLVTAAIGVGVTEGFQPRVLNGPAYWIHLVARMVPFVWVAIESLRYGATLRKRAAIGLADPLVADRFRLWGLWSVVLFTMAFSDPISRFAYYAIAGTTTEWVPEVGRPIIQAVVPLTSVLGLAAVALLFLTFFPTKSYRAWVTRRTAAAAARS